MLSKEEDLIGDQKFCPPIPILPAKTGEPQSMTGETTSCVVSSYLDFLFFLLVKSSFGEIVLKIDVGLCSSTSLSNCRVLDTEVRMSELLLPKEAA